MAYDIKNELKNLPTKDDKIFPLDAYASNTNLLN